MELELQGDLCVDVARAGANQWPAMMDVCMIVKGLSSCLESRLDLCGDTDLPNVFASFPIAAGWRFSPLTSVQVD